MTKVDGPNHPDQPYATIPNEIAKVLNNQGIPENVLVSYNQGATVSLMSDRGAHLREAIGQTAITISTCAGESHQ
jgi:hypothetical protein